MELFIQTALSFPVVVLSFALCVAILYWLVAAMGILDVDLLDIEVESSLENHSLQPEGLAGLLLKLGLNGVPEDIKEAARAFGATVIATAGSDEKCAACLQLGAHEAINYKTQDFVAEANRITQGKGVDVVLDMVAGDYVAREVQCLAEDGRIVIIAVQGGIKSDFNAGLVLRRRLTITGSTLRPRSVAFKGAIARALREHVWPLLVAGRVRPVIHSTFAATEAAKAHALMESNQHIGKIVLTW